MFLRIPQVASVVVDALGRGAATDMYDLAAFVIMSNHVHVLIRPHEDAVKVMKWLKGSTARSANLILGRTGRRFWQEESYDHWVRDDAQFERIVRYFENNPVTAGIAAEPSQYPWSSASTEDGELKFAAAR
jgi:REP element-mobilizing transposase RayT